MKRGAPVLHKKKGKREKNGIKVLFDKFFSRNQQNREKICRTVGKINKIRIFLARIDTCLFFQCFSRCNKRFTHCILLFTFDVSKISK